MGSASLAAARPADRPTNRPPGPWRQYPSSPEGWGVKTISARKFCCFVPTFPSRILLITVSAHLVTANSFSTTCLGTWVNRLHILSISPMLKPAIKSLKVIYWLNTLAIIVSKIYFVNSAPYSVVVVVCVDPCAVLLIAGLRISAL